MAKSPYPLNVISGSLERIGDKTMFLCSQFPLGGMGDQGVEALGAFFRSLVGYAAHSGAKAYLSAPTGGPSRLGFLFQILELEHRVEGNLSTKDYDIFTAEIDGEAEQSDGCTDTDPFEAIVKALERRRNDPPVDEVARRRREDIRQYLDKGGKAEFSLTGADLEHMLYHAVRCFEQSKVV